MGMMSPGQFRVLCIEDEPAILRDIVEELHDHGFRVEAACSAEAAVPIIDQQAPDLIVCDMQMPGMSGLELLEQLRARGDAAASIPFVFLTAFSDRATMISGRKAGADDYLVKPVDYELLIAAVESHLHNAMRRSARVAAAVAPLPNASGPSGTDLLLEALGEAPAGAVLVIARADNPPELARRFAHRSPAEVARLSNCIARRAGVEAFWLDAYTCALVGTDEPRIVAATEWLRHSGLRGSRATTRPEGDIRWSMVRGSVDADGSAAARLEQVLDATRLVQHEGGNRALALGSPELQQLQLASSIRAELVTSIRHVELHVCFQPKIRARDGTPVAAEVLVRWESPMLGQLSPSTFIPIIESAGLLPHLTDWVLQQAARSQILLASEGLPAKLAVNIGASEFNTDLSGRIDRIFAEHGATPELLEIEITETSVLADPASANTIIKALQSRGITVALDDFGTGFSSLSYLQTCHVDAIKIDRSFVFHGVEREGHQKIVQGIIGIANLLALEIIAEGVETEAQRRYLSEQGCTTLQGYLMARPLTLDAYRSYLHEQAGSITDKPD